MKENGAFAPSHITGIFQIFDQSVDSLKAGSKGAGVSLCRGVTTVVKAEKSGKNFIQVKINGSISNSAEVSKHVGKIFVSKFKEEVENHRVIVEHQVEMPIGAGFGTSGAAALSLALALNETFKLGMSKMEAAQIAHIAEVECKTGLGTVIAETYGGIEIRTKPGAPGIGEIKHIPAKKDMAVACLSFGPLSTRKFLTDEAIRKRINESGGKLLDRLMEKPSVANFMKLSRQFAENVGLLTDKLRSVLKEADEAGFVCSMPMFGESVFTIAEKDALPDLLKIFERHGSGGKTIISEIDFEGARLLP
ncbi:MAG: pantoate kinase [Candidatus Bathyarchaeota archaeon]|nr:pantoate kinase [Candidatus Bathyarchaeota archaeon]